MFLASYTKTRPGIQGIGNIAIRFRLDTTYSHSELVFEPGDGVDHLMPDGTTEPNEAGELWCASSVFAEKIPDFSPKRAGQTGGIRFKRIDVTNGNWEHVKIDSSFADSAAKWFVLNQGCKYDYLLIAKFALWLLPHNKDDRMMCSECISASLGFPEPDRIDPAILHQLAIFLRDRKITK